MHTRHSWLQQHRNTCERGQTKNTGTKEEMMGGFGLKGEGRGGRGGGGGRTLGVALVLLLSSPPLGRVQHGSSGLALAQGQEPAEQRPGRLRTSKAQKRQHHAGGDRQGRQRGLHAPNGPPENERRPGARVGGGGLEDALPSPGSWREALEEGYHSAALRRQRRRAADDVDADTPDIEMDSQGVSSPDDAPAAADNGRANEVWSQLSEATEHLPCSNPPCVQGEHILEEWMDLAEEMSHVDGAVVVRRPELIDVESSPTRLLSPANSLDYVKTLQSYFPIFKDSLFSRMMLVKHPGLYELPISQKFLDAVEEGDDMAAMYLSTNYATDVTEVKEASDGYESVPAVVSMADVYVEKHGFFWNDEARLCQLIPWCIWNLVAPNSCQSLVNGRNVDTHDTRLGPGEARHGKVVVLTQEYGLAYYHLLVENLSRITIVLDMLLENPDIKVAVHTISEKHREYIFGLFELLGISQERVMFIEKIHADLALVPPATVCGKPNAVLVTLLRHALLQGMYPDTGGVPPTPPKPIMVLIVRAKKRGLGNNAEVRDALIENFPDHDVVEFFGTDPIREQLELFATASVIVAPHGAGLANIVVSPLHTMILEIGPIECPTCYVNMAIKLQHIYARHAGSDRWDDDCSSWYEPNVDEIVNLVRDLFVAKRMADEAEGRE
ncbi:unnamed protein product [Ectocarpus sp. 12 AP-2014]